MSPLTEEEGRTLLVIARQAIEAAVLERRPPDVQGYSGNLAEPGGAFVTLRREGELRGCIGHVEADEALTLTVANCAASAALYDPRFPAVLPAELPHLDIEISVLSPLTDIAPEAIEIGRHGLMISSGFRRGLLLPQVPLEWGWDRESFLEQTCAKAGLPTNAWRRGARIQGFTTQIIAGRDDASVASSNPAAHSSSLR
ncbi:MAG TPA: AmmeMemoRadiSam system protein A [Terriglobia bacterium]|nr:AmmeMemoRadiSam system protein A [Terriglobia bacterium]